VEATHTFDTLRQQQQWRFVDSDSTNTKKPTAMAIDEEDELGFLGFED